MIFGFIPLSFRFRGRVRRLQELYRCFLDHPEQALHPTQIARYTGMSFSEVNRRLEATPELFVKLPRRPDGITRYRLASSMAARTPAEIDRFLQTQARRESLLLYALGLMMVCLMIIVLILVAPVVRH